MKSLIMYDEFGPGMGLPSIRNSINRKSEYKDEVIWYLKNKGEITLVAPGYFSDGFTGKKICSIHHKNDGVYSWISCLAYYIENYDLEIPQDFVEHVLRELKKQKVEQYCEILTKDGYKGHIVEIFDAEKGETILNQEERKQ